MVVKEKLFGVAIESLMLRQKERYPTLQVPVFLILLRDTIIALGGTLSIFPLN